MNRLEDKIWQYLLEGREAGDKVLEEEIRNDPSFDQEDFDLMVKIWDESEHLGGYRRANHAEAWERIQTEAGLTGDKQPQIRRNLNYALAAVLLFLVAFGMYRWLTWDPYMQIYAESDQSVLLPDSTRVAMSEGTTIRYLKLGRFENAAQRAVYFEGDARFEVSSNPDQPFQVISRLTSVHAIGTTFKFTSLGDSSRSENVEGLIDFVSNTGAFPPQRLNPGDVATFDGAKLDVVIFEPEPPPKPTPEPVPSNLRNVTLLDLVDILTYRFERTLVPGPGVGQSTPRQVVAVDFDQGLVDILEQLRAQEGVVIDYDVKGRQVYLNQLSAEDRGLQANYSFSRYVRDQR